MVVAISIGGVDVPYKVENDLDPLPAIAAGFVWCADDDLPCKRVCNCLRYFWNCYILFDQGSKVIVSPKLNDIV